MSRSVSFPSFVVPMQPQLAKPFHRVGWVYEEKVDSWRILAVKRGRVVRLWSRIGRDHADRFPDVARAVALPGRELVVDGEVAVFDDELLSRFEYLTVAPPPELMITPPVYIAFDVLQVRGRDLRTRPLTDRRRARGLVDGSDVLPVRRLPDDDRKIRARIRTRIERILARGSPALVERLDVLLSVYDRNGERGAGSPTASLHWRGCTSWWSTTTHRSGT